MTQIANPVGSVGDPTTGASTVNAAGDPTTGASTAAAGEQTSPVPQTPIEAEANYRLVIEDDEQAGCFVYKTIDWRTGAVVQQIPREQVLRMREDDSYLAGGVIDTKA